MISITPPPKPLSIKAWFDASNSGAARIAMTGEQELATYNYLLDAAASWFPGYVDTNRNTYQQLFNSIQASYPNAKLEEVLEFMMEDFKTGISLTPQMVTKAILHVDQFDARWSKLPNDIAALSPRTPLGKKLIQDFLSLVNERYSQANAQTEEDRLVILETIKAEIQLGACTSPVVKSKLESLINLSIQRTLFAIKVKKSGVPYLSSMSQPERDCWLLLMDSKHHANGIYHFENEQGYMAAMLSALNLMLDTLYDPLDAKLLCTLHDTAVDQVHERTDQNLNPGTVQGTGLLAKNFRKDHIVKFQLVHNATSTWEGQSEFLMSAKTEWSRVTRDALVCEYPFSLIRDACLHPKIIFKNDCQSPIDPKKELELIKQGIDTYYRDLEIALNINDLAERKIEIFECRKNCIEVLNKSPLIIDIQEKDLQKACEDKAAEIIATYHRELADAKKIPNAQMRETAILTCIAKCCQDLFQHHVFDDGNTRTDVFLVMNKLLLQNGLSPSILHEPNVVAMYSLKQIVKLIRKGQTMFSKL